MDVSSDRIILKYDLEGPVDLQRLAASFDGVVSQYNRVLEQHGIRPGDADVRLFVTTIKTGSVEAEIGAAILAFNVIFTTMDYAKAFADFAQRVRDVFRWLAGETEKKPHMTISDCKDFRNFLSTVRGRKGNILQVTHARLELEEKTGSYERRIVAEMKLEGEQIESGDARLIHEMEVLALKALEKYKTIQRVSMWLRQANVSEGKATGRSADLAYIPVIWNDPVPLFFLPAATALKSKIINIKANPLKVEFVVDVHVTFEDDKPKRYTLLEVHEVRDGSDDNVERD